MKLHNLNIVFIFTDSPDVNDKQSQAISDLLEAIYPRVDKPDYIIRLEPIETNQNAVFQFVSKADSSVRNTERNASADPASLGMPEPTTEPPAVVSAPAEVETVDMPIPPLPLPSPTAAAAAANNEVLTPEEPAPSSKPEVERSNNTDSGHQLICCLCKKEFHSRRSVRRHIRKVHKKKMEELKKFIEIKKRPNKTSGRGRSKNVLVTLGRSCPVCFKSFATKANVRRHFDEVHRGLRRDSITPDIATKPGQPLSLETASAKKSLKAGKQKSSKAEYNLIACKCLLCKRKYSSQVMLKRHMLIVHKITLSTKNAKKEKKSSNAANAVVKVKVETKESAESVPPSVTSPQNEVNGASNSSERKNVSCAERKNAVATERKNVQPVDRKNISSERKNAASTERKNAASTERKNAASSERKNAASTERKNAASTERKNAVSTERKNAASTERKNAASTERKAVPSIERKNASSTERKGALSTERKGALSTERKGALSTERKGALSTERKGASSTERKAASSTERKGALFTERKSTPSTERKSTPSTERKSTLSTERKSTLSTERKSTLSTERKGALSTERKRTLSTERKSSSTERKNIPPAKRNRVKQSCENSKSSNWPLASSPKKPRKPRLSAGFDFKKLYCKLCKRQFTSKQNLTKHIELHTDGNNIYVKFYRCPLCTYETRRKRDVIRHITVVHKKSPRYLGKITASLEIRAIKKPIDCVLNKVARRGPQRDESKQNGSKQDVTTNSPTKKYEGPDVGIEVKVTKNFSLHRCNKCGKAFAKKTFLEHHKKTHKANASHTPEENNKTKGRSTRSKALVC